MATSNIKQESLFPLKRLIICSILISFYPKSYWSILKMKLTAGSTDVHGKTQNTTATNSKLKRKVMGTIKIQPALSVLGKQAKRSKKVFKKRNLHG